MSRRRNRRGDAPHDTALLRIAERITSRLRRSAPDADGPGDRCPDPAHRRVELLDRCQALVRNERLLGIARARCWSHAAARLREGMQQQIAQVRERADAVLICAEQRLAQPVTLRNVVDELRQLTAEFEDVEFKLKEGLVIAGIGEVELDDVALGPFAIELHLKRLDRRYPDSGCFACVALRPYPAGSNSSITHPHVQDGHLCAGEASEPIATALREGRVFDAFCLVRAVLRTYNPGSAYVALDNWVGNPCHDCGHIVEQDRSYYCDHCEQDYCDDCTTYCEVCDQSCCRSCLERDRESGLRCCPACRRDCAGCHRTVVSSDVDEASGLCPACLREREGEQAQADADVEWPDPPDELINSEEQSNEEPGTPEVHEPGQPGEPIIVPDTAAVVVGTVAAPEGAVAAEIPAPVPAAA